MSETASMQKHIRRYILFILFAFTIIPGHAQKKGYAQGYIINLEGDIVEGWVKDRSAGNFFELYKRIRFKPEGSLLNKKYSPDEILGYGLNDQHFESVPLYEETAFFKFRYYVHEDYDRIFLKVVSMNADLTYFHWEYVDSESNYLDYTPLFYREGSDEMVRVTQGIRGLKRKRLIEYFWDCPALVKAVENKELNEIDEVYDFYLERCAKDTK
jgi:hypothetical protein